MINPAILGGNMSPDWAERAVDPDGYLGAHYLVGSTTKEYHYAYWRPTYDTPGGVASQFTLTIYAKAQQYSCIRLMRFGDQFNNVVFYKLTGAGVARIHETDGWLGPGPKPATLAAGITALPNGWYECWLTCDREEIYGEIQVHATQSLRDTSIRPQSEGTKMLWLWGAQIAS